MSNCASGPLLGLRVVEFAGIGPAPFCAMLLSDLGADVVRIDRPDTKDRDPALITERGRRSVVCDLKTSAGTSRALSLCDRADILIEGFRPGVMERLGLGPEILLARNAKLIYGRMSGFGQDGPLARLAGHDINYIVSPSWVPLFHITHDTRDRTCISLLLPKFCTYRIVKRFVGIV